MKKLFPKLKVNTDKIQSMIVSEILKRDVLEGENSIEAKNKIKKALTKKITSSLVPLI